MEQDGGRKRGLDEKFCESCGAVIKVKAEICPRCGVRQRPAVSRNKVVAGLLALFLGGFGIHKFYLGRGGMGVLYLLFCWTFIPTVISFFEAIILFTTSDVRFAAKYPD